MKHIHKLTGRLETWKQKSLSIETVLNGKHKSFFRVRYLSCSFWFFSFRTGMKIASSFAGWYRADTKRATNCWNVFMKLGSSGYVKTDMFMLSFFACITFAITWLRRKTKVLSHVTRSMGRRRHRQVDCLERHASRDVSWSTDLFISFHFSKLIKCSLKLSEQAWSTMKLLNWFICFNFRDASDSFSSPRFINEVLTK